MTESRGSTRPATQSTRIALVVTTGRTAHGFVSGFANFLASRNNEVFVLAGAVEDIEDIQGEGAHYVPLPFERDPHPVKDLRSLVLLIRALRAIRPDVVAYATPKASLLTAVASFALRVPRRVYQLWGLRLETVGGMRRSVLCLAERLTSCLSSAIIANSPSLAAAYTRLGLNCGRQVEVVGAGSSHGVDLQRFSRKAEVPKLDDATKEYLENHQGLRIGFVGRMHPDKGVDTLLDAAEGCRRSGTDVAVILVGGDEGFDWERHLADGGVAARVVGRVSDPRPYYEAMDVLVLPSRREGFPNVVLEAAAMGVPAIVSDATGAIDSVVHGVTGLVVPVGDSAALTIALSSLAHDPLLRSELGTRARDRAEKHFDQAAVWRKNAHALLSPFGGRP